MDNTLTKPSHILAWQTAYLEKHKILPLFHELARELIIQQPKDHVLFLKQILVHAARSSDKPRILILKSPKVNTIEIATLISKITNQALITEDTLIAYNGHYKDKSTTGRIKLLSRFIHNKNTSQYGWIIADLIKTVKEAKLLLKEGVLPTHVFHFTPPNDMSVTSLIYCHVTEEWLEYRRTITLLKDIFKKKLRNIVVKDRSLDEIVTECLEIIVYTPGPSPAKPRVLLLGLPGSGKRTQARLLAQGLNLVHVDLEKLLCEAWLSSPELRKTLQDNGMCYPPHTLIEIINKRVLEEDCLKYGWVLTGFPTCKQYFENLNMMYSPPNRIIFLECEPSVCKERLHKKNTLNQAGTSKDTLEKTMTSEEGSKEFNEETLSHSKYYEELKKNYERSAHFVDGNQSEKWVYETIVGIISSSLHQFAFNFGGKSNESVSDHCSCTPLPI